MEPVEGRDAGVWFFSLEASNRIAVWIARSFWHLNYQFARMMTERRENRIRYETRRLWPDQSGVGGRVEIEVAAPISHRGPGGPGSAEPATLEHFLAERYVLDMPDPRGHLLLGRVHPAPYPLRGATCVDLADTLLPAASLHVRSRPPDHVLLSDGVCVRVFSLEQVRSGTGGGPVGL